MTVHKKLLIKWKVLNQIWWSWYYYEENMVYPARWKRIIADQSKVLKIYCSVFFWPPGICFLNFLLHATWYMIALSYLEGVLLLQVLRPTLPDEIPEQQGVLAQALDGFQQVAGKVHAVTQPTLLVLIEEQIWKEQLMQGRVNSVKTQYLFCFVLFIYFNSK